ncbi:replication restart DNA helicase PriA [Arboricoccus pini]|uniref:Replication restart protein PriA n=1 Tax=Arboricoccus pini TaxID=1963835 RepID=A0A212QPT5_9PROT|nr:primosomal protein N' [Arboricoccus pini]SNB61427.1 replication restart DNA helicase PriA [Arboricoccus pini]
MAFPVPVIVPVLLPLPLDQPYDYLLANGDAPSPGSFVVVPFGPRELLGIVWSRRSPRPVATARLKSVQTVLDTPPLPPTLLAFMQTVADHTLTPLGQVLRLAIASTSALAPAPLKLAYRRGPAPMPVKPSIVTARVLAAVGEVPGEAPIVAAELGKRAKASAAALRQLALDGLLQAVEVDTDGGPASPDPERPPLALDPQQEVAAAELVAMVEAKSGVALLDGVPGSGKTEVYFEAVAAALRAGRKVLVLLPEIALSAQWLERFVRRFGEVPVAWHSGLTSAQRRDRWRWIARGQAKVVVGARSALFLPLTDLGLIVVDEEHDQSFKQEEGGIYHARDMAIRRAAIEGCPIVLASATPSLETILAAGLGGHVEPEANWRHLHLPARHGTAPAAALELIDLRRQRPPRGAFLSVRLRQALQDTLERDGQSLLFLNRRGYAPLALCRACGHRFRCPNCSAWLTAHRLRRRLQCHHCGYGMPEPAHCPSCGTVDSLALSGPGVERVAEEVRQLLPEARIAVMTSDTVGTANAAEALVAAMAAREVDILIGTQMVAKGHHFPDLLTVGVIDADLGLAGGDLRASERTFQLLYQVAGRAGREARAGRVLVQTHVPDHPVLQALASGDRDRFLQVELAERQEAGMPPLGRLAALILSGPERPLVEKAARELARAAPFDPDIRVLGPAQAPIALLRGRWRERLLVKASAEVDLQAYLRGWLGAQKFSSKVMLTVDIDPQSFF